MMHDVVIEYIPPVVTFKCDLCGKSPLECWHTPVKLMSIEDLKREYGDKSTDDKG